MLLKNISIVFFLTILSKSAGFLRDIILVSKVGANAQTDSFFAILNIVETIFMFSGIQIFFSMVTNIMTGVNSEKRPSEFTSYISTLMIIAIPITLITFLFPNLILKIMYPGFTNEILQSSSRFLQFYSINIIFLSLIRVYNSSLGIEGKFIFQNIAPLMASLIVITISLTVSKTEAIEQIIIGLTIGNGALLIIESFIASKYKYRFSLITIGRFVAMIKKTYSFAAPLWITTASLSIALWFTQILASKSEEGTITLLGLGSNIVFAVVGLVFTSILTVIYPTLTKHFKNNEMDSFKKKALLFCNLSLALFLPISLFLVFEASSVVNGIFFKSNFSNDTTNDLSKIIMIYSISIVPLILNQLASMLMQSIGNNSKNGYAAVIAFSVQIIATYIGFTFWGGVGVASGLTVGNIMYALLTVHFAKKLTKIDLYRTLLKFGAIWMAISSIWMIIFKLIPWQYIQNQLISISSLFSSPIVLSLKFSYFIIVYLTIAVVYKFLTPKIST